MLLGKLKAARKYTDIAVHGTMKLTAYFGVMSYCVVSRVEKLMVSLLTNESRFYFVGLAVIYAFVVEILRISTAI